MLKLKSICLFIAMCSLLPGSPLYAFQPGTYKPTAAEKTWLFTNDYVYIAGEHLWFKVQSKNLENQQLSALVYVSLLDKSGRQILQQKLLADEGVASGMLKLPDTLRADNYALVAYTRYGIARSPEHIASQLLKVGGKQKEDPAKPLLKLFFEGGQIVQGNNKVLLLGNIATGEALPEIFLLHEKGDRKKLPVTLARDGLLVFDMPIEDLSPHELVLIYNKQELKVPVPEPAAEAVTLQLSRLDASELQLELEGQGKDCSFVLTISRNGNQIAARQLEAGSRQLVLNHSNWPEGKYTAELKTEKGELSSWRSFYLGRPGKERSTNAGKIIPRQSLSLKGQFTGIAEGDRLLALVVPAGHPFSSMERFVSPNLLVQNVLLTYPDIPLNDALIAEPPATTSPADAEAGKELNIFTHAFESYVPDFPSSLGLEGLEFQLQNRQEEEWLREKELLENLLAFYYPKQRPYLPEPLNADKIYRPDEYEQIYSMQDFFQHIAYEVRVSTTGTGEVKLALRYNKGEQAFTYKEEPLYVIDGYKVDKKAVLGMQLEQVAFVSLLRQQRSIDKSEIGPSSYHGIIAVQTKQGDYAKLHNLPPEQRLYKDLQPAYVFTNNPFDIRPDNLSTPFFHFPVFWQPQLSLQQNSRFKLQFRHTDSIGNFNLILIGFDQQQRLRKQTITYTVIF